MTRLRLRHVFLLCVLAFAAGGCSDDDDDGADAAPLDGGAPDSDLLPPIDVDSFCASLSLAICDGLEACDCRFDVRPYDAVGCLDARIAECRAGYGGEVATAIADGKANFDEASVAACLDGIETMAGKCELAGGLGGFLPTACSSTLVATASIGEECPVPLNFCDVAGAGVCITAPKTSVTSCVALPGDGILCLGGQDGFCAPGLVCNDGTCVPPVAEGKACTTPFACASGLVCDNTLHCVPPLAAEAECLDTTQCQTGLTCTQGKCTAGAALGDGCTGPSVCGAQRGCGRAPETRTCTDPDGVGDMCSGSTCAGDLTCAQATMLCTALPGDGQPCLDNRCAEGATCVEGSCAKLPGLGDDCLIGGDQGCATGLACNEGGDNKCVAAPGVDQPCGANGSAGPVCAEGLGCDFDSSSCKLKGGVGTPCATSRTCTAETHCDGDTSMCVADFPDGEACDRNLDDCRPGSECFPFADGDRCAPLPVREAPCIDDCAADLACKGPGGECVPAFCVLP